MLGLCLALAPVLGWTAQRAAGSLLAAEPPPPLWAFLAAAAILTVWAVLAGPRDLILAASLILAWSLIVLAVIDVIDFRLPDLITLPLAVAGLAVSLILPAADFIGHLAGAAIGYGLLAFIALAYRRLRGRDGLGLGDAKLMAAAGAWLGWQALPSVILVGCGAAFVWIAVNVARKGKSAAGERIAFGAPLCLAIWIVWLHGPLAAL